MSSRNPDDLRTELENTDFSGDPAVLNTLRAEARETVDAQRETMNDIDTKASRILRLNVLLLGAIISVLSIAAGNEGNGSGVVPGPDHFVNSYLKLGVASLVLSTTLAAATYTASELDVGVSSDNVTQLLQADFSDDEAEELLVKNYAVRINFNRSTNVRNLPLVTATIVCLVASVVLFALGTYEAANDAVPWWLSLVAGALLLGAVLTSGMLTQTVRAIRDIREWR